MGSKLEAILNAAKRALGAGEKGFVGNAEEQLARVKPTAPAAPKATGKPEGMAVAPDTRRDDAWNAARTRVESSTGPRANVWDQTPELSAEHRRGAAAVEAQLRHGAGGNMPAKPVAAGTVPQAPAGMRVEQARPDKPLTADQKFAQAKARVEGKPDPYGPVSHNTGGLSLQQPAATKPNPDSVFAAAKARVEGGSPFGAPAHAKPGEMGLQARPDAWKEAQERNRAADQAHHGGGEVSMARLTEAQQRDAAWDRARGAELPAIDMQRLDTSGLGSATPVGTSAVQRRPAPSGNNGPGS